MNRTGVTRHRVGPLRVGIALALAALLTSCSGEPGPAGPGPVPSSSGVAPSSATGAATPPGRSGVPRPSGEPRDVATGLDLPWSVAFPEPGTGLVSERDTALVKEVSTEGRVRTVGRVAGVAAYGEGGLLGLEVSPDHPGVLFAYYSAENENRVVRMPLRGRPGSYTLGSQTVLLDGIPRAAIHNGGRIKFGPDGLLYITTGEAGLITLSQQRESLGGKILRITADGDVPTGNPWPGSPVYSLGHRNPQGIAWDAAGQLWAAEFGQNTWDELNRVRKGANYGWPRVEGIDDGAGDQYDNPVVQWSTAEASPSGLVHLDGTFFLAALRGERLWQITPTSGGARTQDWFEGDFGRLRDVVPGPTPGTLWLLTSNTGRTDRPGDDRILEVRLAR